MQEQIIISGFGGQGALFAGQVLTYAALKEGRYVTWLPSYGPEMRGGTARCTVTISDEAIGSPITAAPTMVIAMNPPSMERFEPQVKPGGYLFLNSSIISAQARRKDITCIRVPATEIAEELGNERMANMVLLGALIEATGVVSMSSIVAALEENLPERRRHLLDINKRALERGVQVAEKAVRVPR